MEGILSSQQERSAKVDLKLGIEGFEYRDLHDPRGLRRLHEAFFSWLNL